jgi:flagellar basal-body rod protein FlgB
MTFIERFFDRTFTGLHKAMDLTWRRNEAIVSNVANAETPQFRAADLNFGGELDRAFGAQNASVSRTNQKHLDVSSNSAAHLASDMSGATKPDGNNVDIDIQMGRLAYNAGQFSMATDAYRKKLGMLKTAIREAGR